MASEHTPITTVSHGWMAADVQRRLQNAGVRSQVTRLAGGIGDEITVEVRREDRWLAERILRDRCPLRELLDSGQ